MGFKWHRIRYVLSIWPKKLNGVWALVEHFEIIGRPTVLARIQLHSGRVEWSRINKQWLIFCQKATCFECCEIEWSETERQWAGGSPEIEPCCYNTYIPPLQPFLTWTRNNKTWLKSLHSLQHLVPLNVTRLVKLYPLQKTSRALKKPFLPMGNDWQSICCDFLLLKISG